MIVKQLELKNFRNYEKLSLSFDEAINILYGDNAQGKTNILESIFMCATTKSHKSSKDRDIIRLGYDEAHIQMYIEKMGVPHKLDMHLRNGKAKTVAVDGISIRKSSDFFGMMNVVFFSPEDLNIIKNGPAERRKFMDMDLCQLDRLYMHQLSSYNKILLQRNNLLKQSDFAGDIVETIDVWDSQLIACGNEIINSRNQFINDLNSIVGDMHEMISGGKERLMVNYVPNISAQEFERKLKNSFERDFYLKTTTVGPHRDELEFYVGDKDLKTFGSQGQQRTAALALKLAEIELVRETIGEDPILLLDDVLSELDRKRQHFLLDSIEGIQTIITCTGLEEFVGDRKKYNHIYRVENGTVKQ
ncbi:MAG: DNA replication/repair protein RecF [Lachnospiraceae bacterium]|nr:DNA replication/repair protein RecF [Lachnospiraceae bacterium]